MSSPRKKGCHLKTDCPKYLLLDRIVFYEIKVKQLGPGSRKETFSFFTRYSKLLTKHQALYREIPKKSPLKPNFPGFPPKNYCKRLEIGLIIRRQAAFKRYYQGIVDLLKIKTIVDFRRTLSVLFNHEFDGEILGPTGGFKLPYDPLKDYAIKVELEAYPEISLVEVNEANLLDESKCIENVKSILLNVDSKNQKILKYSENLTFILFLDERLGKGAYGEVYKGCTNMNENEVYAIKEITIPSKFNDNYQIIIGTARNEINILKTLNHENIVKYVESFENANNIYLVMEYCNDGNMEHYIKNHDLAEKDVIALFRQIINGFKYLHKKDVCHRDIKPSNFLLDNMKIKISDFGFARVILNEAWTGSHIGTYPYMAPQILQGKLYNNMSDIWSLGVTLFFMLFKRIPWVSENPFQLEKEIREKLKNNRLFETVKEKKRISKYAEDLLIRMIVYDENLRITWDRLFDHPLLQEQAIFGVETPLKASIIDTKYIRNMVQTKSEFMNKPNLVKKKKVNLQTDCIRFYCGGNDQYSPDDAWERKKETTNLNLRNNSNLSHYSMVNNEENPFLKETPESEKEDLNIVNRKKGKSTNSALIKEQIEQTEKSKKESIEDLKHFHSQFSFMKKKPSIFNPDILSKVQPNVAFPSINNESENNSKNVSISRDKPSESDIFFKPFSTENVEKIEEESFFQPFSNFNPSENKKESLIDKNEKNPEFSSNENDKNEKKNEEDESFDNFQAKTAKFDTLIEEEEKTPFVGFGDLKENEEPNNTSEKDLNDNRHSFKPTYLQKTDSTKSEEEKEEKFLNRIKKEVKFSPRNNDPKPRDTLSESRQTACFKERLTTQSSLDKSNNLTIAVSKDLSTLDEINENNYNTHNNALNPLEQKSYHETMMKFKRQDHIRKSYSIANKKLHRKMTYERNILLFICNVAERLQEQQEFFDFDPQNLTFFLYLLAKVSLLHLQSLRDEENLVKVF